MLSPFLCKRPIVSFSKDLLSTSALFVLLNPPSTRVYALYPETNQRTLEEMNLVFASDSIWTWDAEREFKLLKEQNPQIVQANAVRVGSKVDTEFGIVGEERGLSLDVGGMGSHELGNAVELNEMGK